MATATKLGLYGGPTAGALASTAGKTPSTGEELATIDHTRASVARQHEADFVHDEEAVDTLRQAHYVIANDGRRYHTTLLEDEATPTLKWSADFSNAWNTSSGLTRSDADSLYDGQTASQFVNDGSANGLNVNQTIGVFSSGQETAWIECESVDNPVVDFLVWDNDQGDEVAWVRFTFATETVAERASAFGTIDAMGFVDLGNGRYRVWMAYTPDVSAQGNARKIFVYPTGERANSDTGILHLVNHVEAPVPSSGIVTGATPASDARSADDASSAYTAGLQDMTVYMEEVYQGGDGFAWEFGDGTNPRFSLRRVSGQYRAHYDDAGESVNTGVTADTPALGDRVETRVTISGSALGLATSVNNAAEVDAAGGAIASLVATLAENKIHLGSDGAGANLVQGLAASKLVVLSGANRTRAECRAAEAGDADVLWIHRPTTVAARTVTAAQRLVLPGSDNRVTSTTAAQEQDGVVQSGPLAPVVEHHLWVEVQDSRGTWVDLGSYMGDDWQLSAECGQTADQRAITGAAELILMDEAGNSLSPLVAEQELLKEGRGFRIYGAVVSPGTGRTAAQSDRYEHLNGYITDWEITEAGDRITIEGIDSIGGRLAERWVESEKVYSPDSSSTVEAVAQEILDDWTDGITLYVPEATNASVEGWKQQKMPVIDALNALVVQRGFVIEPRWDDTTAQWRPTLYSPERNADASAWSFGPGDYFGLSLRGSTVPIRNAAKVTYTKASTGERSTQTLTDANSVREYARQWMEFEFGDDSPIDTDAEATSFLTFAISDLAYPPVDQEQNGAYFPLSRLNDYYTFNGNSVHYSEDQTFGVVGYRHEWSAERGARTRIQVRGKPTAGTAAWKLVTPTRLTPFAGFFPTLTANDELTGSMDGNERTRSVKILASKVDEPTTADLRAETAINGTNFNPTDLGTINDDATGVALVASPGDTLYIVWEAYSEPDGGGLSSDTFKLEWQVPAEDTVPTFELEPSQTGSTGTLQVNILTDPLSSVQAVRFKTHQGSEDFDFSDPDDGSWTSDATVPYSQTVGLVGKHNSVIVCTVEYLDEAGATAFTAPVFWTFDADEIAEIATPVIGFDQNGQALITLSGDEDAVGIIATLAKAGAAAAAITAGTTMQTTAAITAGDTSVAVDAVNGFAEFWCHITDGDVGEVVYCQGHAASTFSPGTSSGFANNYASGATITQYVRRTTHTAGGVESRSGTFVADNDSTGVGGGTPDLSAVMGEIVECKAAGINRKGEVGPTVTTRRRRGDLEFLRPIIKLQATRIGSSVSVDFEIEDAALSMTADLQYKRRDGDTQTLDTAWQTTWDTSTGTAGTNTTLVRKVTLDDPYTAIVWRAQYTDENGNPAEIGDELDLASVQEIEKHFILHASELVPATSSTVYEKDVNSGAWLRAPIGTTATQEFTAGFDLPPGVTVTNLDVRFNPFDTLDTMLTQLFDVDSSASRGVIASVQYDGVATGWQTDSATVSEEILETRKYGIWVAITQQSASEVRWNWLDATYAVPSFKQTY